MSEVIVGIDFGTTQSSLAVWTADSGLRRVKEPINSSYSIPSCARLQNGELSFGMVAENGKMARPSAFRSELKRELGTSTPIVLDNQAFSAIELIGEFLRFLRGLSLDLGAERPDRVILTIPASYDDYRKRLMAEAARLAGFDRSVLELVAEPVAASYFALGDRNVEPGSRYVVYDFGGGTFDAALVEAVGEEQIALRADPVGIADCGGWHINHRIAELLWEEHHASEPPTPPTDREARQLSFTINDLAIKIKHQLSAEEAIEDYLPGSGASIELTRRHLEELIDDLIEETLSACDRMLAEVDIGWPDLEGVILVGGSTRLPFFADRVAVHTGLPVIPTSDPELAIVDGATLHPPGISPPIHWDEPPERQPKVSVRPKWTKAIELGSHDGRALSVALGRLPTGEVIAATGGTDHIIRLWDPVEGASPRATLQGHRHDVRALAFGELPDGRVVLASGSWDQTIRLWDIEQERLIADLRGHRGHVSGVAFGNLPDGRAVLASGSWDQTIRLWDPELGIPLGVLAGHKGHIHDVAFGSLSGNEPVLASVAEDLTVRIWNPMTQQQLGAPLRGGLLDVRSTSFGELPGGHPLLATASLRSGVRLWDPVVGSALAEFSQPNLGGSTAATSVAFATGPAALLACGMANGTVAVWDADSGLAVAQSGLAHQGGVEAIAIGKLGNSDVIASVGSDGVARLWQPES